MRCSRLSTVGCPSARNYLREMKRLHLKKGYVTREFVEHVAKFNAGDKSLVDYLSSLGYTGSFNDMLKQFYMRRQD